jgi:hypothetical protein
MRTFVPGIVLSLLLCPMGCQKEGVSSANRDASIGGGIAAGGNVTTGGAVGTGGNLGAGGILGTGGSLGLGGRFGAGGVTVTGGGVTSVGVGGAGGRSRSGGSSGSGGKIGTGGSVASGGAVTGGAVSTGGGAVDAPVVDATVSDAPIDRGGSAGGDAGVCATCGVGSVCVEDQTEGGAIRLPNDAGQCQEGYFIVPGGLATCSPLPSFHCAQLPAACNTAPGSIAVAHCVCAPNLCTAATCTDLTPTLVQCLQLVP